MPERIIKINRTGEMKLSDAQVTTKANETLAAYVRGGRLPHALLLEGGHGEGDRELLAKTAAQGALCQGEPRPCGECSHCRKVEKGIHPDFLTYGSDGGAKSFHIDTVREIRQQAFVRPNEAEGKVFLLQNVQDMSPQAQNALLKIIEEPPNGVVFLLTCPNKSAMLETILSRVAVLSLDGAGEVPGTGPGEEPASLEAAEAAAAVLLAVSGHRELDALELLSGYERNRAGLGEVLESMRNIASSLLVERDGQLSGGDVQNLQKRITRLQMLSIVAIIDETAAYLRENGNGLLLTTAFCARLKQALE